jgi:metal transporter CNNM
MNLTINATLANATAAV